MREFNLSVRNIFIGVIILFIALRLFSLGSYPLMDTTESRYGEIGREMFSSGDWITPYYPMKEPYWGKPPFSFWMTASSMSVFGVSEFSARLPSLLMSILIIILVYYGSVKIFNQGIGFTSTMILIGTGSFFVMAGVVCTDIALTLSLTLSMISFAMALKDNGGTSRRLWGYLFFIGLAMGLLSKGPVAIAIAFIALSIWIVITREYKKTWKALPWISGMILTLLISVPWYILAERKTPGFLNYFILGEHFKRFLQPGWSGDLYGTAHKYPLGTIWFFFLGVTLPWIIILIPALFYYIRREFSNRSSTNRYYIIYFSAWAFAPAILFTVARNVQMAYVIPAVPAISILTVLLLNYLGDETTGKIKIFISKLANIRTMSVISALIITSIFIASISIIPMKAEKRTQKKLINLVYVDSGTDKTQITYIGVMPFSGAFYSNGRAIKIKGTDSEIEDLLDNARADYFIAKESYSIKLKNLTETGKLKKIGESGYYSVYKEIPL